jgi:hypothetical protein
MEFLARLNRCAGANVSDRSKRHELTRLLPWTCEAKQLEPNRDFPC